MFCEIQTTLRIDFFNSKLKNDKQKSLKLDECIIAFCALFNTNGGRIILHSADETECCAHEFVAEFRRRIDQKLIFLFGLPTVIKSFRLGDITDKKISFLFETWPSRLHERQTN